MNCKICSSKTEKIKDIKKDIYYYKCKECDFVFIDEKNIYSTEDEKVRYLKHNNTFENNGFFIIVTLFHPESIEKFLKWWYKEDITHISFFTQKTFKHIAEILKMKLVKINSKNLCVLQKS